MKLLLLCLIAISISISITNASFGSLFGRGTKSTQQPNHQIYKHLHRHEVKVIHDNHGQGHLAASFFGGGGVGIDSNREIHGYHQHYQNGGHHGNHHHQHQHNNHGEVQVVQVVHDGLPPSIPNPNTFHSGNNGHYSGSEIVGLVEDGHLHGYGDGHSNYPIHSPAPANYNNNGFSINPNTHHHGGLSTSQIVGYVEDGHHHENHHIHEPIPIQNNGLTQSQIVGFVEDEHIHANGGIHHHNNQFGHNFQQNGHNSEQVLKIVHDENPVFNYHHHQPHHNNNNYEHRQIHGSSHGWS